MARITAVRVLEALGGDAACNLLQGLARDPDATVQAWARRSLAILRGDEAPGLSERGQALVDQLRSAGNRESRADAAEELGNAGEIAAIPALRLAYLQDPTRSVRYAAMLALGQLGDAEMLEPMARTLRNRLRDDEAAKHAASALGALGDSRGLSALLEAFADGWNPTRVADGLNRAGEAALIPLLDCLDERPDLAARRASSEVTGNLARLGAVDHLLERLDQAEGALLMQRARSYLKLALSKVHMEALARRVLDRVPPEARDGKPARTAAEKILGKVQPAPAPAPAPTPAAPEQTPWWKFWKQ